MKRIALLAVLVLVLSIFGTGSMAAPQQQDEGVESVVCGDNIACTRAGWAVRIRNDGGGGVLLAEQGGYVVGIKGVGRPGVLGASGAGMGVQGKSTNGYGVFGTSVNDHGIFGKSEGQNGVYGLSTGAGVADSGVYGETNSTDSEEAGVWGFGSDDAMGIRGESVNGWGGYLEGGQNDDPDLVLGGTSASDEDGNIWSHPSYASSDIVLFSNDEVHIHLDEDNGAEDGNFDVYGGDNARALSVQEDGDVLVGRYLYLRTLGGQGMIYATSQADSDMWLGSNDDFYVDLDNDNNSVTNCFYIRRDDNSVLWSACDAGATASGTSAMAVETSSGQRKMYAMGSTELWFEDFGSADLVDGKATVGIDALFAEVVSLESAYHVYLTPVGNEPVLLFVTAKTPTGFEVQGVTLDGKPASVGFDYRIVAKRLGYEGLRLEEVHFEQEGDEPPDGTASDPGPGTDEAPVVGESVTVEMSPGGE